MSSVYEISGEELEELEKTFVKADIDGNGFMDLKELRTALKLVGFDMPGFEVRRMEEDFKKNDQNNDGKLSFKEFQNLYTKLKTDSESRSSFKNKIRPINDDIKIIKSSAVQGENSEALQSQHFVKDSEKHAFCKWINNGLKEDVDLNLSGDPLKPKGHDLFERCSSGLLICKLINFCVPGTIDERSLNKPSKGKTLSIYQKLENNELALRSAEAIGCHIVNMRPSDIMDGKEYLILGLLWQTIQIGLFSDINLVNHPDLVILLNENETLEELLRLTTEEILIRWFNYQLSKSAYVGDPVRNFSDDIKNSVAYVHLLNQIAPADIGTSISLSPLNETDLLKRAEQTLCEAEKLNSREFVDAGAILSGHQKLNMAFVANLFNNYPALGITGQEDIFVVEETREEKTYRNWMNSLGVKPKVNYLYSDLQDGLIIFQLYDVIKPRSVDWNRVVKVFVANKKIFQKLNNCNYVIEIGKNKMNLKLVGIQGSNLLDGHKTFFLALFWQLMRAYVISLLQKLAGDGKAIGDKEILAWANEKLRHAEKDSSIESFQDPSISDSRVVCDLVDAIRPGSVKYENIKLESSVDARMENARYAVSLARKVGARVFALPEDIVELKPKMVMTVFATLMILDYQSKAE